jgi:uncharacterized protein YciI
MPWFLILQRHIRPRQEWTIGRPQHLAWIKQLHDAGKMVISGPTPELNLGIYLIKAESRKEAEQIAASDPFTAAGYCKFELFEWEIHQILGVGTFSVDKDKEASTKPR